ncbi:hypothetical protein [Novipirellula galeiformis]|uniref:hypothetical protein n=1 Tax=Novipirellula galeiformis TaxID=2528004 RepID=UPI001E5810EE|nr:hypothetical protein [Novipirellula galeiformis]
MAQSSPGYYTDPQTGIVYRQVTKTIERPVVETKTEQREQTIYRPQTVTETKPEARTVYTPIVQYEWQPRLEGRWNPFRQPTVAYHSVPQTRWESRNEVVHRTNTRTEWIAEKRTVEVPQRLVRMEREQKVDYEVVGRVAPQQTPATSNAEAIASRLRPLDSNTRVEAFKAPVIPAPATQIAQGPAVYAPPRIAASSLGRMTSDPPRRSTSQVGLRTNELYPAPNGGYSGALPPATTGVAALPALPLWR